MKKLLFLITSILAVCTVCTAAGCHGNQGGPDTEKERPRTIEQQDIETPEEDNDCKDGDCEGKKLPEGMPEFRFRPHRHFYAHDRDNKERETENDGDENEDPITNRIEPIHPHKKRPHKGRPGPMPMPVKPKN